MVVQVYVTVTTQIECSGAKTLIILMNYSVAKGTLDI